MNLLFAIDDHYLEPLMTTLFSIAHNNAHRPMVVYVIQKERLKETDRLISLTNQLNMTYHPLIIGDTGFSGAKVSKRYPEAVYYRLLAHRILPKELDRVLYLDADILCINDLSDLYHLDLTDQEAFAAADHAKLLAPNMKFHKYRLQVDSDHYYNSGVLLMNLPVMRRLVQEEDIYSYIEANQNKLILPDQDVLNALYGDAIRCIPNEKYNVDMRLIKFYEIQSLGQLNPDWMIDQACLLHFCGNSKPWQEGANGSWEILYKQYARLASKLVENQPATDGQFNSNAVL